MSSRFMIDMPKTRASIETVFLVVSGALFMAGPFFALIVVLGDHRMPVAVTALLIISSVFSFVGGSVFIRHEISKANSKRAEAHLKSAVKRLGYIALEPIEVHGHRDRVLLRDEEGPALWDVSLSHNKVVCAKRT